MFHSWICYNSVAMFLSKVEKTIRRYELLNPGDKVIAACSGGPDSVALLQVLKELPWKLNLIVAHFNHGLRESAEKDEKFVKNLARRFSLECECRREDIREFARKYKMNLEEAGRNRRYAFLEETARKHSASRIAAGHTLSDQAETVLMHLFRGTGLKGLGGISPQRDGIIRPLLEVSRKEVLDYLKEKRLSYRMDETNVDPLYLRSRIRYRVMPVLKNEIHPAIEARLSRLAEIIRAEEDYMSKQTQEAFISSKTEYQGRLSLEKSHLEKLPLALRRRVIREFCRRLRGSLRGITFNDTDILLNLKKDRVFPLEKGLVIKNVRGRLTPKPQPDSWKYDRKWKGETPLLLPEIGLHFVLKKMKNPGRERVEFDDRKQVWLDADRIAFPLRVRSRRPGDRYRPLGAPGRKPIKEIFRSRDIPPETRDRHPVFLSRDRILWVLGLPAAHEFRITDKTSHVIKIKSGSLEERRPRHED